MLCRDPDRVSFGPEYPQKANPKRAALLVDKYSRIQEADQVGNGNGDNAKKDERKPPQHRSIGGPPCQPEVEEKRARLQGAAECSQRVHAQAGRLGHGFQAVPGPSPIVAWSIVDGIKERRG